MESFPSISCKISLCLQWLCWTTRRYASSSTQFVTVAVGQRTGVCVCGVKPFGLPKAGACRNVDNGCDTIFGHVSGNGLLVLFLFHALSSSWVQASTFSRSPRPGCPAVARPSLALPSQGFFFLPSGRAMRPKKIRGRCRPSRNGPFGSHPLLQQSRFRFMRSGRYEGRRTWAVGENMVLA